MPILECKKITLAYENNVILDNLSFSLNAGDYLCIIGENGSGKSTLVKALLGLKKVEKGEIFLDQGLTHNQIGYLSQQNEIKRDFPASVCEVVLSGCINQKKSPFFTKGLKALAMEKMRLLGVDAIAKRSIQELSGGQRQRVLLARALCSTRDLLLLDEPVAGLDPLVTEEMYQIIQSLNQKEHMTIVMVSHDMAAALAYASHILFLKKDGFFFGTKEEYLASPLSKEFVKGVRL